MNPPKTETKNDAVQALPERLAAYARAAAKAVDWLAARQQPDGFHDDLDDLSGYYKSPYCYVVNGRSQQAGRCAEFIKKRYLQPNGDFRTRPDAKGWFHLPCSSHNRYVYSNGWLVVGLQKMGRYDLSIPGIRFIESMLSNAHGGAWSQCRDGKPVEEYMNTSSTASAGLALLVCGRIEKAVAAGDFVLRVIDAQTAPDRRFYCSWHVSKGLRTALSDDEDHSALASRKQYCLSAEHNAGGELTWMAGKPMKFLTALYDATNERRFLRGAAWLVDFFQKLTEERWTNYSSCKIMWATAALWRQTDEVFYLEICQRIADFLCETQLASGTWLHTLWYPSEAAQPLAMSLDMAQELGAELADVICDLSLGQGIA